MITKKPLESISGLTLEFRSTSLKLAQPVGTGKWKNNTPTMMTLWSGSLSTGPRTSVPVDILESMISLSSAIN
jgi:hypothetical protein